MREEAVSSKLDGNRVTCLQDAGSGKDNAFSCSATSKEPAPLEPAPLLLYISKPGAFRDAFPSVNALVCCYTGERTLNCKFLFQRHSKMAALKWKHCYEDFLLEKHLFFFFTFVLHDFLQSPEYNPDLWQLQAMVWSVDKFILQNIFSILISSQCLLWVRGRGKRSIWFPSDVTV